jgi:hypothetical protein
LVDRPLWCGVFGFSTGLNRTRTTRAVRKITARVRPVFVDGDEIASIRLY